jgi:hypothetical protein
MRRSAARGVPSKSHADPARSSVPAGPHILQQSYAGLPQSPPIRVGPLLRRRGPCGSDWSREPTRRPDPPRRPPPAAARRPPRAGRHQPACAAARKESTEPTPPWRPARIPSQDRDRAHPAEALEVHRPPRAGGERIAGEPDMMHRIAPSGHASPSSFTQRLYVVHARRAAGVARPAGPPGVWDSRQLGPAARSLATRPTPTTTWQSPRGSLETASISDPCCRYLTVFLN